MSPEREQFYKSQAWKHTAVVYARYQHHLCEICKEQGLFTPGEIVHHKIHLDDSNFSDPEISLNWDNLQLVCRKHHAELHKKYLNRFIVDELGRVTAWDTPPIVK